MDNDDAFSAFLHGLEDEINEVDPVVDFGPEAAAPVGVQARTPTTDRTIEEPLTYLCGIMCAPGAAAKTATTSRVLLDDGDLFLLN
jgi:hypothetical protein